MEIYIEYAVAQNFLFDYALLYLAAKATKINTNKRRLCVSAVFGTAFAVIFPFLRLSKLLGYLLKYAVGLFMCLLLMKDVKSKNAWGRYALTCIFFFIFSFAFGGVLLSFMADFFKSKVPPAVVVVGFAVLTAFSVYLIGKLHEKRAIYAYLYDCEVVFQGKSIKTQGFWDSGNLALKDNIPVCFLSPSLYYDVFLDVILIKPRGQGCDEMKIHTIAGVKKLPLYRGEVGIQTKNGRVKKEVYFAPSKNMLSREYSLLLPSTIFEDCIVEEGRCNKKIS